MRYDERKQKCIDAWLAKVAVDFSDDLFFGTDIYYTLERTFAEACKKNRIPYKRSGIDASAKALVDEKGW